MGMMLRILSLMIVALVLAATPAWTASGVKGRAAWRGELVPGIQIRAYRSIADVVADKQVAVSDPVGLDGTYQLELPPGEYVMTARNFSGVARPGDYYCYYSGSPIRVREGAFTNVGFNLIRVPEEQPVKAGKVTGIEGEITFQDELLKRVYLYVYQGADDGFKGPGYNIVPVEKGHFRLRLPPGDYYLLARKRAKGGRFGPIEIGDFFNFYYRNPVRINAGEVQHIHLETITRLSMLEADEPAPFRGFRGRVLRDDGSPAAGLYVFGYREAKMTGTPDFFSARTSAEGRFELAVVEPGDYYLLARESFGGPAADGEWYGKYQVDDSHAATLAKTRSIKEVTIHVQRHQDP